MPFFHGKSKRKFAIIYPMRDKDPFRLFLASGFGLGLAPIVPGSFGALPALAWHFLAFGLGWSESATRLWCLWGALLFSGLHYWLTPWAQRHWRASDPRHFVLDEIVGYLCVPLFMFQPITSWWQPFAAFAIFRILDAIKLPGARYIDRNVHTASGVLFDDVFSAFYSACLLSGAIWLLNG